MRWRKMFAALLLAASSWAAAADAPVDAAALYATHCATCHGAQRLGGMGPALLAQSLERLRPGDAHFYDVHVIHSPRRDTVTKLVRIEGSNLDRIKRSNIKAASKVTA